MAPTTRKSASNASKVEADDKKDSSSHTSSTKLHASNAGSSSPSKKHRNFKSLFKPRTSLLDFETLMEEKHPMRGFFVLFWVSMAFRLVVTSYNYWRDSGALLSLDFLGFMGKDVIELFVGDGLMVCSLGFIVLYQWLITWGIIPLALARILQHSWQCFWFLTIISWIYVRDWAWTQSATLTLHTIAMLMKQHSYTSYNIDLNHKKRRLLALQEMEKKDDVILDDEESAELLDLHAELTRGGVMFPANQTFTNFFDYLLVPTLVYELGYPRTSRFRLWFFAERVFNVFALVGILYFIIEHQVNPVVAQMSTSTFVDSVFDLILPFMTIWILIFFLIFECLCNAFAEITCFADREFYGDWWNSTNYEEFARLWNKPVHHFLLRHLYKESIENLNFSKTDATLFTFFLSSCMHELVFVVIARKIRFYLFFLQMFQLPLIFFSKLEFFQGKPLAGNIFFWFGIFVGPPFIAVCYVRDFYIPFEAWW